MTAMGSLSWERIAARSRARSSSLSACSCCLPSVASSGTATLVNRSAALAVARAPSALRPIAIPCNREVRGISDGPNASRAANVSSGAAGDATTGFSHPASRRTRSGQSASPTRLRTLASSLGGLLDGVALARHQLSQDLS
jgi:hypothetical protein